MSHLNWSIEKAGKCPDCGAKPILIVAFGHMRIVDEDDQSRLDSETIEVDEEISGHLCIACSKLVSLSLNT